MSTVFQDTFTGVDGTLLQNHTPDVGNSWVRFATGHGSLILNSNTLAQAADGGANNGMYRAKINAANVNLPNGNVSVTVKSISLNPAFGDSCDIYLFMRAATTGDLVFAGSSYALHVRNFPGGGVALINLSRMNAGTENVLWTAADTISVGDVYKLDCTGSIISAYKNGTLLQSITNSVIATGKVGLYFIYSSSDGVPGELDNFLVDDGVALPGKDCSGFSGKRHNRKEGESLLGLYAILRTRKL